VFVRRPHELCDDASQPVAAVVVERGLHAAGGVAAVRVARHGDGAGALRHDRLKLLKLGRWCGRRFAGCGFRFRRVVRISGCLPRYTRICDGGFAADGFGIRHCGPESGSSGGQGAEGLRGSGSGPVPSRLPSPTSGYRRHSPTADLPIIGPAGRICPPAAPSPAQCRAGLVRNAG